MTVLPASWVMIMGEGAVGRGTETDPATCAVMVCQSSTGQARPSATSRGPDLPT